MMSANKKNKINKTTMIAALLILLACAMAWQKADHSLAGLWQSPDRQAQILMDQEKYLEAAELFNDSMHRGEALFKAGEFKRALRVYNTITTPEGIYNRGNTQMMLGKYDAAIALYDRALSQRPDWEAAMINREIAIARKAALDVSGEPGEGTGGKLGADEIVFDDRAKNSPDTETVETNQGEAMGDEEMRALWLRKVQTKPADFLRAKFSYQFQRDQAMKGDAQ